MPPIGYRIDPLSFPLCVCLPHSSSLLNAENDVKLSRDICFWSSNLDVTPSFSPCDNDAHSAQPSERVERKEVGAGAVGEPGCGGPCGRRPVLPSSRACVWPSLPSSPQIPPLGRLCSHGCPHHPPDWRGALMQGAPCLSRSEASLYPKPAAPRERRGTRP